MDKKIGVGVLTYSLAAGATTEMQILPAHNFRAEDGRPTDVKEWVINDAVAQKLIAKLSTKKNKQLIDYEHQSLRAATNGNKVVAAGWYTAMEWRPGSGMWVKPVSLTKTAQQHVNDEEYLFTSPVFTYDTETGEILDIINVALTNTPAVDGMQEIAALTANNLNKSETTEETNMTPAEIAALNTQVSTLTTNVATLTAERDTANTKVTALTAERDAAHKELADLKASNAAAQAAEETKKRDDMITAALNDGRLIPAQKEWASKQSLAALTDFLGVAPVIVDGKLQHEKDKGEKTNDLGLTTEEMAMCSQMQQDPKAFAEQKKKLAVV